jgi:tripartite-type tricarboxylate transporter receptor subunit TctC
MKKLLLILIILASITNNSYARQNIELIVPYGAGGGFDLLARRISSAESPEFKLDVVNKTGGAANIAHTYFVRKKKALLLSGNVIIENKKWAPDGYPQDILALSNPLFFISEGPHILYTSLPVSNIEEMIELSKTEDIIFGGNSPGSGSYTIYDNLCNKLKVFSNCIFVSYRSSSFAIPDLLAGRIKAYGNTYGAHNAFVSTGKSKAILILDTKRFYALPEVTSIHEKGYLYDIKNWIGLFSIGLSPEEAKHILSSVNKLMTEEEYRKYGYEKIEGDPRLFFQSQIDKFNKEE